MARVVLVPTLAEYMGGREGGQECAVRCPLCGRRRLGLYEALEGELLRCLCGGAGVWWVSGRGHVGDCLARGEWSRRVKARGGPILREVTIEWRVWLGG